MGFLHRKAVEMTRIDAPPVTTKEGDVELYGDIGWTLISGQRGAAPQTFAELVDKGYRQNPVVSAALHVLAAAASDAPLRAQQKVGDEWKWIEDDQNPANAVVAMPNGRDSRIEIVEKSVYHYFLGGNWFWEVDRIGTGRPTQLFPIRPDKIVKAITDSNDIPLAYVVQDDNGKQRPIDAINLIHVTDVDPWNAVFGLPRLLSSGLEIRTDNEASDYVSEILTNHGQPGMIIGVDKNVKARQLRRAEEFWDERFGPGRGRGKVAMVAGATHIQQIGFDLRMLEFPDLRIITRESICSVLGVDPILVAIGSASRGGTMSGNEHKEARVKLWYQTVIPMLRRWEAGLDRTLAPKFGTKIRYRFDLAQVVALQEDRNKQFERAGQMAMSGSCAPQEIRREFGLPEQSPYDTIIQSVRTVVATTDDVFVTGGDNMPNPVNDDGF